MMQVITGISYVLNNKGEELMCLEELMQRAIDDSGIKITEKNQANIGIFLGTTFSNFCTRKNNFDKLNKIGVRAINPADFPKLLISYLGGCLSIKFGTKGALSVLSSGSASGIDVLQAALFFLQRDKKNIAFVLDLDESRQDDSSPGAKAGICFICENIISAKRRKVYANILRVETSFERKNEISGLCECIKKILDFCSSRKIAPRYFFGSQTINSSKHLLENKAIRFACQAGGVKFFPALNPSNSSLKPIYAAINSSHQKKIPAALFVNIGEDANSACVAIGNFCNNKIK
jgi:hypothetical protein